MATARLDNVYIAKIEKTPDGGSYTGNVNIALQLGSTGFVYQVHFERKSNITKAVEDAVREIQTALNDLSDELGRLYIQL
jgi:hypothetical protein